MAAKLPCAQCGGESPHAASYCMHCGERLALELIALAHASEALTQAEDAYWQAIQVALRAGHSQRVVAKTGQHNHSVISRKLAKGEL